MSDRSKMIDYMGEHHDPDSDLPRLALRPREAALESRVAALRGMNRER